MATHVYTTPSLPPPLEEQRATLRRLRQEIADEVARSIAFLDALDGDPDLEYDGDTCPDADREPSLGSIGSCGYSSPQTLWASGSTDDQEDVR